MVVLLAIADALRDGGECDGGYEADVGFRDRMDVGAEALEDAFQVLVDASLFQDFAFKECGLSVVAAGMGLIGFSEAFATKESGPMIKYWW